MSKHAKMTTEQIWSVLRHARPNSRLKVEFDEKSLMGIGMLANIVSMCHPVEEMLRVENDAYDQLLETSLTGAWNGRTKYTFRVLEQFDYRSFGNEALPIIARIKKI